jgi:hypothetical protein
MRYNIVSFLIVKVIIMRTTKQLLSAIGTFGTKGTKVKEQAHALGMEVLEHINTHGDVTVADAWLTAIKQSGMKVQAAKAWLALFGKVKSGSVGEFQIAYAKHKETNLEGADSQPFYDIDSEKKAKQVINEFDADKALAALLKRIQSARADGKTIKMSDSTKQALGVAL